MDIEVAGGAAPEGADPDPENAGRPEAVTGTPRFAHPVEEEFARIFDEHGIAWEYESHAFVLERAASHGRIASAGKPPLGRKGARA